MGFEVEERNLIYWALIRIMYEWERMACYSREQGSFRHLEYL
jgi:hypothetical protein